MANILVVDDDADMLNITTISLEKDGHWVSRARDGAEALKLLGVSPEKEVKLPELVILDVMMPVMDGFTVAAKLAEDPRTRSLPLIVLTAKGQTRDLFQASGNVVHFLDKPFDLNKLRELALQAVKPRPLS